jgi:hypothetical protein
MMVRVARTGVLASALVAAGVWLRPCALRAAGLNGSPPPHAGAFKHLIGVLTDNWEWLVITSLGFVIILVGGMMAFGDIRAPSGFFG